jgi:NTF2 fold immunity protein
MPGGPFTQAQLISGLEAHGYRDVALGNEIATPGTPRPELLASVHSADDPEAQKTSVHLGWNGRAVKDGQPVNIYIRPEAPASLPPDTATARDGQTLTIYLDRVSERTVEERKAGQYFEPRSAAALPPAASAPAENRAAQPRGETISSDIALRLAEMVFVHSYGREVTEAQLPLSISDGGDRWEVHGRKAASSTADVGRLGITIMKADARIIELVK